MKGYNCIAMLLATVCCGAFAIAEVTDPDPRRFEESIEAFAAWDRKNSFPEAAILFVGSSSIRLWPTAETFPGKPIINRGFGGSELSDVIHFYDRVIKPYAPARIFLYAGDNDIAGGKSAGQVFYDYKELVEMVRSDFPNTELIFISIKPSKQRWDKWPIMSAANGMIREYADKHSNCGYADLANPLLGDDGRPRDVFEDDGLHLNAEGYLLWQQALAPHLDRP